MAYDPRGYYYGNYYLNQWGDDNITNGKYIYNFLRGKGWTRNACLGILSNIEAESRTNPGIWEGLIEGRESRGYGLTQWTPMSSKIKPWQANLGVPLWDMDGQLKRIEWERENNEQWYPRPDYPATNVTFSSFAFDSGSAAWKTELFLCCYEIPGHTTAEVLDHLPDRLAYLAKWQQYIPEDKPDEWYAVQTVHYSQILVNVGDVVKKGDVIGVMGGTGHATGPHVHTTIIPKKWETNKTRWWQPETLTYGGNRDMIMDFYKNGTAPIFTRDKVNYITPVMTAGWWGIDSNAYDGHYAIDYIPSGSQYPMPYVVWPSHYDGIVATADKTGALDGGLYLVINYNKGGGGTNPPDPEPPDPGVPIVSEEDFLFVPPIYGLLYGF